MFPTISIYVLVLRSIPYFLEHDTSFTYCQVAVEYSLYLFLLFFIVNWLLFLFIPFYIYMD